MSGWLYLIRNRDLYKIGITKNIDNRMRQLKPDYIVAKLYTNDFIKYGERKICFIKGEYVFARKVVQKGDEELVCHHSGSKKELYKPSKQELELGKKVYEEFSKKYDLSYYRLDVTSDRKNPIINYEQ